MRAAEVEVDVEAVGAEVRLQPLQLQQEANWQPSSARKAQPGQVVAEEAADVGSVDRAAELSSIQGVIP
jgi:hypothetical protein